MADYIERMKDKQDKIYYITAESYAAAKSSPHLGIFKEKGIEVLLMHERVDEWMMSQVSEFDGKNFQSITSTELDLGELADEKEKKEQEKVAKENKGLIERMKAVVGDDVDHHGDRPCTVDR